MRVLAIGDIHGCLRALDTLLDVVQPGRDDLLVPLGDYVDRGLDSAGVLDRLIQVHGTHKIVSLRGNHDQMMLDARRDRAAGEFWLSVGGQATLDSYPGSRLKSIPKKHWRFLEETCVDWHETQSHILVHAHVEPDLGLAHQSVMTLHWKKLDDCQPHHSGKTVVCGHTRQRSGLPLDLGHTICLDTGPANDGWLTCLDVDSGQIWQANEARESRTLNRDDLTP